MKPLALDTQPEAEQAQVDLLRGKGSAGRVRLAVSLCDAVIALARRGIRRRDPGLTTEDAVTLRLVALHHGADVALEFRRSVMESASRKASPGP